MPLSRAALLAVARIAILLAQSVATQGLQCQEGWTGYNCILCTADQACSTAGGPAATCIPGGQEFNNNTQVLSYTCEHRNWLMSQFIAQGTFWFQCQVEGADAAWTCDFGFQSKQDESKVLCQATRCTPTLGAAEVTCLEVSCFCPTACATPDVKSAVAIISGPMHWICNAEGICTLKIVNHYLNQLDLYCQASECQLLGDREEGNGTATAVDPGPLLAFRAAFENGDTALPDWNKNSNPCRWEGVICDDSGVSDLRLSNKGLRGTLSDLKFELLSRTVLKINLGGNNITGALPIKWSLPPLLFLALDYNSLNSTLPADWDLPDSLEVLWLDGNNLSGTVPNNWRLPTNLTTLYLGNNKLEGVLPEGWVLPPALRDLRLERNKLAGGLPYSWQLPESFEYLTLRENNLRGPLQAWKLPHGLKALFLNYNYISSTIPPDWVLPLGLESLDLSNNQLTGSFPFNKLVLPESLKLLTVYSNKLEGTIPSSWTLPPNLKVLNMGRNAFNGSLWRLTLPVGLVRLEFSDNQLTGSIDSLRLPETLEYVYLDNNQLVGPLPRSLPLEIREFNVFLNQFEGTIPATWRASSLTQLQLHWNNLQGTLPYFAAPASALAVVLPMKGNLLCGNVPSSPLYLAYNKDTNSYESLANGSLPVCPPSSTSPPASSLPTLDLSLLPPQHQSSHPHGNSTGLIVGVSVGCAALAALAALGAWLGLRGSKQKALAATSLDPQLSGSSGLSKSSPEGLTTRVTSGSPFSCSSASYSPSCARSIMEWLDEGGLPWREKLREEQVQQLRALALPAPPPPTPSVELGDLTSAGRLLALPARAPHPSPFTWQLQPELAPMPQEEYPAAAAAAFTGPGSWVASLGRPFSATSRGRSTELSVAISQGLQLVKAASPTLPIVSLGSSGAMSLGSRPGTTLGSGSVGSRGFSSGGLGEAGAAQAFNIQQYGSGSDASSGEARPEWMLDPQSIRLCTHEDAALIMLGKGAFGQVFKGLHNGTTPVAAKLLHRDEQHSMKNMRNEVEVMMACRDPHIVQFIGACVQGEWLMVVQEFMAGGAMSSCIASPEMRWHVRGRQAALDIAQGLVYLHANNIVHYDLKSHNILLDGGGTAKIADFGLSRFLPNGYFSGSSTALLFTFAWASPEVIMGQRSSAKADVFSLGVVLWEIATGEVPLRGAMRALTEEDCPLAVAKLVEACMKADPQQRPTALEVYEALRNAA